MDRTKPEMETRGPMTARKVQKADREKLRRDRLNEQFMELGNSLDPDRPKNDKATILTDTIQVLNDLTTEVDRLKAECTALTEESRELMQEKNELKDEKASLKSDIENLNAQYQQRMRIMYPWGGIDPSVVVPPPYSYPVPIPVPPAPIPVHPAMQPFPFFRNQNPAPVPNPCSTFIQYSSPGNSPVEQISAQYASSSHVSSKQDSKSKSSDRQKGKSTDKCVDSDDVATDLELKMPGSSTQQDISTGERKGKDKHNKERNTAGGSFSSRASSSQLYQDSSSNSIGDASESDK